MKLFNFDLSEITSLDKVLHEPARLSIVACLSVVEEVDFVFLQAQTGMTGGNLSSHIRKLEDKAYISVRKEFQDGKPRTSFRLTEAGRAGFRKYLKATSNLLKELGEI
jgi:DNA-binding MarR family transcriptional regulator